MPEVFTCHKYQQGVEKCQHGYSVGVDTRICSRANKTCPCASVRSSGLRCSRRFYAVVIGHVPGIYYDWESAKKQVHGYSGNRHKSFATYTDALKFYNDELAWVKRSI